MCAFKVSSPKQILNKIIPHFYKSNLITQKQADYLLFKQILMLIEKGEHLKVEGLQSIINIRASLNLGLSLFLEATTSPWSISRPMANGPSFRRDKWA